MMRAAQGPGARRRFAALLGTTAIVVAGCGGGQPQGDQAAVVGTVDSDLPCTPTKAGADPIRTGVGLQDLEVMTLDPRAGLGLTGVDGPSDYLEATSSFVLDASSLARTIGTDSAGGVCTALRDRGWLAGFAQRLEEEDPDEEAPFRVATTTLLFQTPTGAGSFVEWLPSAGWHSPPTTEPLEGAGTDAVLLRGTQGGSDVSVALVADGPVVGMIEVTSPAWWQADVDLAGAAAQYQALIQSRDPRGAPLDLGQVLSAPLRQQEWADAEPVGAGRTPLGPYWHSLTGTPPPPCEDCEPPDGRVGRYDYRLANAEYLEQTRPDASEYPIVGTAVTIYPDAAAASSALASVVDDGQHAAGGLWFDPGVEGAVGLRHWTEDQAAFEGYSWDVHMAHGPMLATAYVRRTSMQESDWANDEQWASAAARALRERLDRVLGTASPPALTPTPQPSVQDPDLALAPAPQRITLVAGAWLSCGLGPAAAAWCWGAAPGAERDEAVPVEVPGGHPFATLDAAGHACALDGRGRAWCWGRDGAGALGDGPGSSGTRSTPVAVAGDRSYTDITTGQDFSCAVDTSGQAWCWGHGTPLGQLGDGSAGGRDTWAPVRVAGEHAFVAVSAGSYHACALEADGSAWCWGDHRFGQLGDGSDQGRRRTAPVRVEGEHTFTRISSGERHTCALDTAGAAWCWGEGLEGALGDGSAAGPNRLVPNPVVGGHRFTMISAGMSHTCALDARGQAWCWGRNSGAGMLGNGDAQLRDSYQPSAVTGDHSFSAISAGAVHTCALDTSGTAWCWGDDQSAQLGQGPGNSPTCPPAPYGFSSELGCSPEPLPVAGGLRFLVP